MKINSKKVLTVMLAAAILAGAGGTALTTYSNSSISVSAAQTQTEGNFDYEELSDGTVKITGTSITSGELEIPNKLAGKTVSEIADNAFRDKTGFKMAIIPGSVKTIGDWAFSGCTGLQSITRGRWRRWLKAE